MLQFFRKFIQIALLVKSYGYFAEWIYFAHWWSFSSGGSAINGATPSSLISEPLNPWVGQNWIVLLFSFIADCIGEGGEGCGEGGGGGNWGGEG